MAVPNAPALLLLAPEATALPLGFWVPVRERVADFAWGVSRCARFTAASVFGAFAVDCADSAAVAAGLETERAILSWVVLGLVSAMLVLEHGWIGISR